MRWLSDLTFYVALCLIALFVVRIFVFYMYSKKFYSFLNRAHVVFDCNIQSYKYFPTENDILIVKGDLEKSIYAGSMRKFLRPTNPEVFWSPLTIRLMHDHNVKWSEWKGKSNG